MGSPIEAKLLDALIENVPTGMLFSDEEYDYPGTGPEVPYYYEATIKRQVQALTYRLDFVIEIQGALLAIECDGFDWHEKNKEQAMRDRARDRALLRAGIRTMRFLGSEIHHFPKQCAQEVFAMLDVISTEHQHEQDEFCRGYSCGIDSTKKPRKAVTAAEVY